MTGDGTAGHRDWPYRGGAHAARARGRITISVIPRYQSASSTDTTVNLPMSRPCASSALATNYAVRQQRIGPAIMGDIAASVW